MTTKQFHYALYGLQIGCNEPIYGLPEIRPERFDDLLITEGRMPSGLEVDSDAWQENDRYTIGNDIPTNAADHALKLTAEGDYLQWRYLDQLVLVFTTSGSRIWVKWPDDLSSALRAFNLIGPGLAMALKLQGKTILHASVVDIGGISIALAGPSGVGKSTLAAAFEQSGYRVLTDDLCVLDTSASGRFAIPPGPPRIRLLPDSAEALLGGGSELIPTPDGDKLEHSLKWVTARGGQQAVPLAAIYFLTGRADHMTISTISPRDALFLLLKNSYLNYISDARMRANSFQTIGELVTRVPVHLLETENSFQTLNKLCRELVSRHS